MLVFSILPNLTQIRYSPDEGEPAGNQLPNLTQIRYSPDEGEPAANQTVDECPTLLSSVVDR